MLWFPDKSGVSIAAGAGELGRQLATGGPVGQRCQLSVMSSSVSMEFLSSSHAHYHSLSLPLSHCSDSVRVVAEQHLPQLITDLSAITDQVGAASLRGIMQHFKNFVSSVRS